MSLKQKIMISAAVVVLVNFLGVIFFADKGYLHLVSLKASKMRLINENEELVKQNISLYRKIERLTFDPEYIEYIARKELGLVGKGEVILKKIPSKIKLPEND
ncbi:MAG: septum formation initiator family protein [Thermodesulfobacteriota bacterium]